MGSSWGLKGNGDRLGGRQKKGEAEEEEGKVNGAVVKQRGWVG